MTDFVLSSGNVCLPHRAPWGAFTTKTYQVSTGVSSAAIVRGRMVTLDYTEAGNSTAAGQVKASTGDNFFYGVGIAGETVPAGTISSAVVTNISVYEANPMVEFRAVTKGANLSNSVVGRTATLHYDSTLAIQYVDLTGSTASDHRVVITGLIDSQGDSGGYVTFRFNSDRREQGSTINSSTPFLAFFR
jgi:hypothetical protein